MVIQGGCTSSLFLTFISTLRGNFAALRMSLFTASLNFPGCPLAASHVSSFLVNGGQLIAVFEVWLFGALPCSVDTAGFVLLSLC